MSISRASHFLSRILRHNPGAVGIELDVAGWADVEALLAGMSNAGFAIDRAFLERVVAENDKRRFSFSADGTKIRANQGHSIPVDLGLTPQEPPELLYHGTAESNLEAIRGEGLKKGRRHAVHLSPDAETARRVGKRHGRPVVLVIHARRMHADGHTFTCSENGVWLVDAVPAGYIEFPG